MKQKESSTQPYYSMGKEVLRTCCLFWLLHVLSYLILIPSFEIIVAEGLWYLSFQEHSGSASAEEEAQIMIGRVMLMLQVM